MQKSLNKLYKIIDDLDGNNNMKEFYKEALLFESNHHSEKLSVRYMRKEYEMLINRHLEDE